MATQGKGAKAPAKKKLPGRGPDLRAFYIVLAVVALGGIGWIGYSVINRSGAVMAPIELTGIDDPQALLRQAQGVVAGSTDPSAAQVLIFSDFTCPACRNYVAFVEPSVKSEFVQTNLIRYTYYDYPLGGTGQHRYSFLAARAARCAGDQGKFWEYHDLLFGRQGEWSFAPRPPIDELVEFARQIGLNADTFRGCLESDKYADVVTANRLLGDQLGVEGTPTLFIGSRSFPAWNDPDAVREAIRREINPRQIPQDTGAPSGGS